MHDFLYFYIKILALMFKYTSQKQLSIFDFHTDFESKLSAENRWVKMAGLLDWDKLAAVYAKNFSTTMGASSVDARIVIGALIIKHIEKRDDRGTIEAIQENPYMQYFLGLDHFTHEPVFDPSLFVYIVSGRLWACCKCGRYLAYGFLDILHRHARFELAHWTTITSGVAKRYIMIVFR